jgi:hypothetical protein
MATLLLRLWVRRRRLAAAYFGVLTYRFRHEQEMNAGWVWHGTVATTLEKLKKTGGDKFEGADAKALCETIKWSEPANDVRQ